MNRRKLIISISVTIIFGIIGCYTGWWIRMDLAAGKLAIWHSLERPPGNATKFVYVETDHSQRPAKISVETSSGLIFRCCTHDLRGWERISSPEEQTIIKCQDYMDLSTYPAFSRFNGTVKDCIRIIWNWEWIADEDYFVILSDGSVWKWRYYTGFDQALGLACGLPALFIGIGWGLIFLARLIRSKHYAKLKYLSIQM